MKIYNHYKACLRLTSCKQLQVKATFEQAEQSYNYLDEHLLPDEHAMETLLMLKLELLFKLKLKTCIYSLFVNNKNSHTQ